VVGHREPVLGSHRGNGTFDGALCDRTEFDIVDPTAVDAHQVVMVILERFGQLVSGHPVAAVVGGDDSVLVEDGEGAVDGGEGDRGIQVRVDLGRTDWSA